MVTYALSNQGLPMYDARGRNLIEVGGDIYDIDGHRIWHFDALRGEGLLGGETDAPGAAIHQPPLVARIQFLMAISGARPFAAAGGAVRLAMTPARASRDPIDYTTKTGSSLYDRATKSLFTDVVVECTSGAALGEPSQHKRDLRLPLTLIRYCQWNRMRMPPSGSLIGDPNIPRAFI